MAGRKPKRTVHKRSPRPASSPLHSDIRAALQQAEWFNVAGKESQMVPLLEPFENQYPFSDKLLAGQFDRLLGFGYAHTRRFNEAEEHLSRGRQQFPEALDFLYGLTFARLSLREFASAADAGDRYLCLARERTMNQLCELPFNGSIAQKPLMLNYLGICYQNLNRPDDAERSYKDAIVAAPSNQMPYLNLASLYVARDQQTQAIDLLQRGMTSCPQAQELRMMADSLANHATVSACLIVRNEEEMLPDCLASIRDWVDEIIVVDTGSNDRTVEIARSYGAQVHEHPWEGNFSKARNQSLQYATKDWLFIIDADERVYPEDVNLLRAAMNRPDTDIITMNVYNLYEEHSDVIVFLPSHRLFRRDLSVRYDGIVHNQLVVPENARYHRVSARIKHLGYGLSREKMNAKADRTRALLEKQLAENPDNAFALFNYAQLLRSSPDGFQAEHAPLIIRSASRAVELTDPNNPQNRHIHLMCLDQLAWTHYFMGQYDLALQYSGRALQAKPDYLDPILLCGYLYFKLSDLNRATELFERYLTAQAAYDPSREMENIILVHLNARTDAHFNLGAIAEIRGDKARAKKQYLEVLTLNEDHPGANLNLGRLLLAEGQISQSEKCFARVVESGKATQEIFEGLSRIYIEKGEADKAEQLLLRGISAIPRHVNLHVILAGLYLDVGRFDDANLVLETAWGTNRSDPTLISTYCSVLSQTGQYERAIAVYLAAESESVLSAEMNNDLGNGYFRQKNFALAESRYRQALKLQPALRIAKRNLGVTLGILHKSHEAIDLLIDYTADSVGQEELYHVIADLYASVRDHKMALTYYERYLQKYPADVAALSRLSDCYLQLGHKDSAILGYRRALQIDPSYTPARQHLETLLNPADSGELSPASAPGDKVP